MSTGKKSELALWHDYDILPGDACLYMGSDENGVDYSMAERTIKNLHILDKRMHTDGITIKMNNIGGCTIHGMAIYDIIKSCKNHVTIIGHGHVMSIGSVIFQAADSRVMTPHSRMMLHMGSAGFSDNMNNFYANVEEFKALDKMILDIYIKRIKEKKPRFTKPQLKIKMATDWYLGPEEAIEFGLCDKIYGKE